MYPWVELLLEDGENAPVDKNREGVGKRKTRRGGTIKSRSWKVKLSIDSRERPHTQTMSNN
jgi:hypothetical protein